jgi:hypothetical protein
MARHSTVCARPLSPLRSDCGPEWEKGALRDCEELVDGGGDGLPVGEHAEPPAGEG